MSKFNVGDRVRVVKVLSEGADTWLNNEYTVSKIAKREWSWPVYIEGDTAGPFADAELELVTDTETDVPEDNINHPTHYTAYKGIEVIQLTEQLNFNKGNAVKYIARAGLKNPETEIEDLRKAAWYINREIERLDS